MSYNGCCYISVAEKHKKMLRLMTENNKYKQIIEFNLKPRFCQTGVSRWPLSQTKTTMRQEKSCAFQYAKMREGIFRDTKIVEDKSELTLDEAKQLWNAHFADAAKWIKDGNTVEMVIWIDMETPQSYGDTLQYISTDAESDGVSIWETKKSYFKQYANAMVSA